MGGKSTSKSSSSSSSTVTQIDRRIGAAEGSTVATEGGTVSTSINIDSLDAEVIEAALSESFGFAGKAADEAGGLVGNALSLVESSTKQALEAQSAVGELGGLKELLKTGTAIAAVAAAAFILPKVFSK